MPLTEYRCRCGATERWLPEPPPACSRCPECHVGLLAPRAKAHEIRDGVCVHCKRDVATLRTVVTDPSRIEYPL